MDLNRTNVILDRVARNKENENWDMIEDSARKMKDDFNNTAQKLEDDFKNVVENISDQVVEKLVDTSKLDWREPVDTIEDLPSSDPIGTVRQVREATSDGVSMMYRKYEDGWKVVQEYDATAINEVDSRLTERLVETGGDLEGRGFNVMFPPAPLVGLKGDGITDDTFAWDSMLEMIPEGSRVIFPQGIYLGNFLAKKALDVVCHGKFVAADPTEPNFKFEGDIVDTKTVVSNPSYGQTTIFLENVDDLNQDDIIVIKDEAARPGDNKKDVNQEVLKIKSVDQENNSIEVVDKIRGVFNTGLVTLSKLNTIKSPSISYARAKNDNNHTGVNFHFFACENVLINGLETTNSFGDGLRLEFVYGYNTRNTKFNHPRSTASGQGYGLAVNFCREGYSELVTGTGTRHVVDFSSSYNCKLKVVRESDGKGAAVVLTHNGFGGNIDVDGIQCTTNDYAVVANSQGLDETNKDIQVMRNFSIKNIDHVIPTKLPNEYVISVMIQQDYSDINIDNVETIFVNNPNDLTLDSSVVRLNGNQRGQVNINNISSELIGAAVRVDRRSGPFSKSHPTNINDVQVDKCINAVYLRGVVNSKIDGLFVNEATSGVVRLDQRYGVYCQYVNMEENGLNNTLFNNVLIDPVSVFPSIGLQGKLPVFSSTITANLSINNGGSVPARKVIDSSALLRLLTPSGQSTTTLSATTPIAPPIWVGQELNIGVNEIGNFTSNRGDIVIPANSNTVANNESITLKTGRVYKFIGYNGKWSMVN